MHRRTFPAFVLVLLCLGALLPAGPQGADPVQAMAAERLSAGDGQTGPATLAAPVGPPVRGAAGWAPQASGQIRGFWVDAWHDGFKTPQQIEQLIADAHTANANTLFVQVRRRGDSYFNESVEPRAADDDLAPEPFDPLASLIEAAHNADPPLQVHAWVVVFPVWSAAPPYTTTDPDRHVYLQHGQGLDWDDPDNWLSYRYNGGNPIPDYQLDPGHPAAARYTVDVFVHLVRHYDVDGLHLDYIRYNHLADYQAFGYNKANVDRFNAVYGETGLPLPHDESWCTWRRKQVTAVVQRIYLETMAIKPDLVVSAATIAWGDGPSLTDPADWQNTRAYKDVFQDWRYWLEAGLIDLAVPMNYDSEQDPTQRPWFEHWIAWEADHEYARAIAVGPGAFKNNIAGSLTQAQKVLAYPSLDGLVFYSYAATNDAGQPNSAFYAALSQPSSYGTPPFPTWVDPPVFPWKEAPTTGHLMGWAVGPAGPLDWAEVTITGPENRTVRSDGDGFFGAVDLPPGDYTVTLPTPAASPLYATVSPGQVAIATVAASPSAPALRAVLVEAGQDGFKTPDQVDLLLADARAANLNAVIVQVRSNGQRYYESTIEPRSDDPELPAGFDPLAYLLDGAHGGDPPLEVYAWLPALTVWDQDTAPAAAEHVMNQHPEWLTQDDQGNQRSSGEYFLDPGHPDVQTYLVDLALDLLLRYPVDGLFFDDLYYPAEGASVGNPTWGYNPVAVERFHDRYGGSGNPAPSEPLWIDWRRGELSALLRRLYLRATALRPRLRIAVGGIAWADGPDHVGGWEQTNAYGRVLQDWRAWLEEGIVDLVAPMNYDREYDPFQRDWYDHWLAWQDGHTYGRGIVVLQGSFLNYPEHTLAQLGEVQGEAVGLASYIPANLYADPEGNSRYILPPRQPWAYTPQAEWWLWRALVAPNGYTDPVTGAFTTTAPLFAAPAPTLTVAWKDAPTLGHAIGRALGPGLVPLDGATVTITGTGSFSRVVHSDGNGFFGAVDLAPGTYWAHVPAACPALASLRADVVAGRVVSFAADLPYSAYLPVVPR